MPLWNVYVTEILHHRRLYVVEAPDEDNAYKRAAEGDTRDERDIRMPEVAARNVEEGPYPLEEDT